MLFLFNFVKSLFLPVQSIEEEYKHVVNEEVSQLNKSIASKENAPNCKEIFQSGDEIEIEFQSNVLHKTIFGKLFFRVILKDCRKIRGVIGDI